MANAAQWVQAARPRTLAAAVVPVAVGVALSHSVAMTSWWRAVLALLTALALQIGTNYANDYSDGVRGSDEERVGPTRLVASRLASPAAVRNAAFVSFGLSMVLGLVLAIATTPFLIPIGAACVAAGWFYTGGPRPYGYFGYGEVFVFVFFGPVAVLGTTYVCSGRIFELAWLASVPVGLLSVILLIVNNLRDRETDAAAGKRTVAVLLGDERTRWFYLCCLLAALVVGACAGVTRHYALLELASISFAIRPLRLVMTGAKGRDLVRALAMTGKLQLAFGVLFAVGIAL